MVIFYFGIIGGMKLPGLCLFAEYYIIPNQRDIYQRDSGERISTGTMANRIPSGKHTKIYWTLPFIVDLAMKNGDFFHSYVNVDEILIHWSTEYHIPHQHGWQDMLFSSGWWLSSSSSHRIIWQAKKVATLVMRGCSPNTKRACNMLERCWKNKRDDPQSVLGIIPSYYFFFW